MEDHRVAARTLRQGPTDGREIQPCTFWLNEAEVSEAALWQAVGARGSSARADSRIDALLSEARKASGMDSTFLVRANAVAHCVNGGPLELLEGQPLGWFAKVREELVAARSWQTHALDRERPDAALGLPFRVKTLFVLPIERSGTASAVMLCGISQMRVVLDSAQLDALNQLAIRLHPMVRGGTDTIGASGSRSVPSSGGSNKARKTGRRAVFSHVFGGRDAVTKRIART